jgi:formimidoylglutamate deiminase
MAQLDFFFDAAFLPGGWARDVEIVVVDGIIRSVAPGAIGARHARIAGAALPGLPNLHSHAFQRAIAGTTERRGPANDSFWTWREAMYRFVDRLDPDDVEAISAMAMMEMLEGGFTSLAEFHYLHHDRDGRPYADRAELAMRIVAAAAETGIGLTLLPVLYAQGGFGGRPADARQRRFLNNIDDYLALHANARRAVARLPFGAAGVAPHSLRAVTPESLRQLTDAKLGGPIHIHISEQVKEVEDCLAWSGRRPVEWLLSNASVDANWCLVHATHMTLAESSAVAASGAVAGLCPTTEANLGDGLFEAGNFLAAGGRYGVGSDSNVEISAAQELRWLEYGQRLKDRSRNSMQSREGGSTGEALYTAASAGGAQALAQPIGEIAPGKRADFVVLDTSHPSLAAMKPAQWIDGYVFVAGATAIAQVYVAGKRVVDGGRHVRRDAIAARFVQTMKRLSQ